MSNLVPFSWFFSWFFYNLICGLRAVFSSFHHMTNACEAREEKNPLLCFLVVCCLLRLLALWRMKHLSVFHVFIFEIETLQMFVKKKLNCLIHFCRLIVGIKYGIPLRTKDGGIYSWAPMYRRMNRIQA